MAADHKPTPKAMTRQEYYAPDGNDGNPINWKARQADYRPGTRYANGTQVGNPEPPARVKTRRAKRSQE